MLFYLTLIALIFKPYLAEGFAADEVTSLPGLAKQPSFRHYSGFLNASKGHYLHYWFVESQSNPDKDPVLIWLTGGPGCSSLGAFFTENGPFRVDRDNKTVTEDPNSWNRLGNVLYLESPVGVGFSYSDDKKLNNSDDSTAEDNYLALLSFFEKFPKFKNNSFYITGESYAGVYIPTLAHKVFESNSTINLKGLAIGNGALDWGALGQSRVRYLYTHGLLSSEEWNRLQTNCCSCKNGTAPVCKYEGPNCKPASLKVTNPYNILNECNPYNPTDKDFIYSHHLSHFNSNFDLDINNKKQMNENYNNRPECVSNAYKTYLKLGSVRKALHIPEQIGEWDWCRDVNYTDQYRSMNSFVKDLVHKYKLQNIIVYNGDLDSVCDFIGDQQFVDELGFKLTQNYTKWKVGTRIAGFVKRFEGITFMAVRGAGHMVPTDQPEAALQIIKELIGISKVDTN